MADSIFSAKIKGGFVDVRESSKGDRYLSITKGKKKDDGTYDNQRVMIWADDISDFFKTLKEASTHLR